MFFETSFRVEKDKKQRNTNFGYKKGLDLKTGIIFESFGCQVFGNAVIHYHTKSILKDLARKTIEVHFSLTFYVQNPKNKKIPFLVTKSGQNLNLTLFYRRMTSKLCIISFFNDFWSNFFHGQKSWF